MLFILKTSNSKIYVDKQLLIKDSDCFCLWSGKQSTDYLLPKSRKNNMEITLFWENSLGKCHFLGLNSIHSIEIDCLGERLCKII